MSFSVAEEGAHPTPKIKPNSIRPLQADLSPDRFTQAAFATQLPDIFNCQTSDGETTSSALATDSLDHPRTVVKSVAEHGSPIQRTSARVTVRPNTQCSPSSRNFSSEANLDKSGRFLSPVTHENFDAEEQTTHTSMIIETKNIQNPFEGLKRVPRIYTRIPLCQKELLSSKESWFVPHATDSHAYAVLPKDTRDVLASFINSQGGVAEKSLHHGEFTGTDVQSLYPKLLASVTDYVKRESVDLINYPEEDEGSAVCIGDSLTTNQSTSPRNNGSKKHSADLKDTHETYGQVLDTKPPPVDSPIGSDSSGMEDTQDHETTDGSNICSWPATPQAELPDIQPSTKSSHNYRSPLRTKHAEFLDHTYHQSQNGQSTTPSPNVTTSLVEAILPRNSHSRAPHVSSPTLKGGYDSRCEDPGSSMPAGDDFELEIPHAIGEGVDEDDVEMVGIEHPGWNRTSKTGTSLVQVEHTPYPHPRAVPPKQDWSRPPKRHITSFTTPEARLRDPISSDPIIPGTFDDSNLQANMCAVPKGETTYPEMLSSGNAAEENPRATDQDADGEASFNGAIEELPNSTPISATNSPYRMPSIQRHDNITSDLAVPILAEASTEEKTHMAKSAKEMARLERLNFTARMLEEKGNQMSGSRDICVAPSTEQVKKLGLQTQLSENEANLVSRQGHATLNSSAKSAREVPQMEPTASPDRAEVEIPTDAETSPRESQAHGQAQTDPDMESSSDENPTSFFEIYRSTYPDYEGNQRDFTRALVYIEWLRSRKHLVHRALCDDFIRVYCQDYIDYIRNSQRSEAKPMTGWEFYNCRDQEPEYEKRVIRPENLMEAITSLGADDVEECRSRFRRASSSGISAQNQTAMSSQSQRLNKTGNGERRGVPTTVKQAELARSSESRKPRKPYFETPSQMLNERKQHTSNHSPHIDGVDTLLLVQAEDTAPNSDGSVRLQPLNSIRAPTPSIRIQKSAKQNAVPPLQASSQLETTCPVTYITADLQSRTKAQTRTPSTSKKRLSFKDFVSQRRKSKASPGSTSTPNTARIKRICTKPVNSPTPNSKEPQTQAWVFQ